MTLPTDPLAVSQGCYFDEEQADKIIRFANHYVIPQFIRGKFSLLPWQVDWLRNLYGWRAGSGGKRFKRAVLHIGKKNGKTLLCSIVALFELFTPDVPSPLVVSASTSRDNALQVYKELQNSIVRNDTLAHLAKCTPSTKRIRYTKNNAEYRALSADAGSAEGLNVSCCVIDECHAHRSEKLYRSLEYSTIARTDATMVCISTAGNDVTHWYFDLYTKAKRVLTGEDKDISFFPTVFELGDGDDMEDSTVWHKANPSLGTSFSVESFKNDLQSSKNTTSDWLSFQRYRLNRWVSGSDEAYVDVLKWDQCLHKMGDHELKTYPCTLGVDLSQVCDPTSISAIWSLPDNRYYVRSWGYVAEDGVRRREKANLPRYQQYDLEITPGDMIDTSIIKAKILELAKSYQVKGVVFDQYSAFVLANEVGQEGITVWRSPQTARFMSEPCKEFNRAILEKRVHHDGNLWLRWCLQNVRLESDSYGNIRPHRERSADHIDGAVAAFMAFGQCMRDNVTLNRKSVYDEREVFMV